MIGYPYMSLSFAGGAGGAADPNAPVCTADDAKENFDSYADGKFTSGSGSFGCGWDGAAFVVDNQALTAYENFDTYSDGAITGAEMTDGEGWSVAPLVVNN